MQENQSQKSEGNVLTSDETYRSLVRTMEHMSEDKIRTTALLERMMNIIENAFNSVEPRKAPSVPVVSDTPEGDQAKPIDLSLDKKYFGTEKEGRPSKKDK